MMELDVTVPVQGSPFEIDLTAPLRYLVNCGAVGQPRDGDSRAAYGILDADARTLTILRTVYDIALAQTKIVDAGLPEVLAQRLAVGR
jgi:diadenosine tetraphosphatase ApaH/serine/threonine PP2A family protein phosphatase